MIWSVFFSSVTASDKQIVPQQQHYLYYYIWTLHIELEHLLNKWLYSFLDATTMK